MIETRFKDTDIGKIPEDWNELPLSDVLLVGNGRDYKHLPKGNVPVYGTGGYMTSVSDFLYEGETVCIGRKGTIDKPQYHNGKIWTVDTLFYTYGFKNINVKFLYYLFCSIDWLKYNEATGVPSLTSKNILNIKAPFPNLLEQNHIASALTSIDNLISSLDELIEKKKNIKRGTMQQLLTGKNRLKEFIEPWYNAQLGKIGFTFNGLTGKTKEDFGKGNAKYITFLNILNNPILKPDLFEEVVIKEGERQNNCHKGDLFFNTSSETPEEVGICAMLDSEVDSLYLNSFCFGYRLTDPNIVPEYLAYYFRSNEGRKLMTVLAQGVTRYNLSKSAFNRARILLPTSFSEQKAIVEVLMCMDNEISALEAKKTKYVSIKQGMMQELLTGKIRLI